MEAHGPTPKVLSDSAWVPTLRAPATDCWLSSQVRTRFRTMYLALLGIARHPALSLEQSASAQFLFAPRRADWNRHRCFMAIPNPISGGWCIRVSSRMTGAFVRDSH